VPESDAARALAILNAHKAVDVQQRAIQQGLMTATSVPKPAVAPATMAAAGAVSKEEVLGLAEEQLDVGKRLVQEGTTRIRRFVNEKPVEAQGDPAEEHARVSKIQLVHLSRARRIKRSERQNYESPQTHSCLHRCNGFDPRANTADSPV
jgi:hypothetical protein